MSLFNFIKSNLSIVDVVSEHVHLKQAGGYWKGPCPFHSEKDASFTVSPDKQIFYCFGCHATGDVISFVAKIENLSQIESVHHIIDRYKVNVPQDLLKKVGATTQSLQEKEIFFRMCTSTANWAHQQMLRTPNTYLYLTQRGLTPQTIAKFTIGYFPGGVANLNLFIKAMAKDGILAKDLLEYGVIAEGRSQLYSSFEERIIFPIRDNLGRSCGFGGRIFKQGDDRAKYYNSKESDGFIKGKILFGFDMAKKSMQEKEYAFLVEGYMDCITMSQYGYTNTVATLGTACTLEHLKCLSRHINTLYVLYDGDDAGQNAMLRLTELCWEVNLELKVIQLPPKEDPASFLVGKGDLALFILSAQDIFTFFVQTVSANFLQKTLSEKVALAEKITNIIAHLDDEFKQDILLQQAASIMQLPLQSLKGLTLKQRHRHSVAQQRNKPTPTPPPLENNASSADVSMLEEKIFSAIMRSTSKGANPLSMDMQLLPYFSTHIQTLLKTYELVKQQAPQNLWDAFLDHLDEQTRSWVVRVSLKYDGTSTTGTNAAESFEQLLAYFCKVNWRNIVQQLKEEIQTARSENNIERLNEVLGTFLKLKQGIQTRGLI